MAFNKVDIKSLVIGLVIGIIALFIGLAFIPSFNAVSISMLDNNPPDKPKFHGPKTGYLGVEYSFTINATDPDGDNITYIVDWCDGTFDEYGPYYSGTEISANHTWYSEDMFTILVNARDIHDLIGPDSFWWIGIAKSKENHQIQETTDDCDCQSNGKTHLAEKLLNRLEKDVVLLDVIELSNPTFERPICNILYKTINKLYDLLYSLIYIWDTLPEDSKLWDLFAFTVYIMGFGIIPYLDGIGYKLKCWD